MLAMVGVPAFIAGVAVLGMAWNAIAARASDSSILVSGANGGVPIGWSIITHTPFAQLPTPQFALAEPTPVNCPMPGDWVAYQVNPTDSLFRLSVVYGVSVEEMQQVNCMGDKTAILPGQIIYVPALATPTPTPTPTAPFFPANLPDQSNHSSGVSQSPPTSPPVIQPAVIPPVVAQGQDKKQKVQPPTNNQGPDKQNKDAKGGGGKNGKGKGKKK